MSRGFKSSSSVHPSLDVHVGNGIGQRMPNVWSSLEFPLCTQALLLELAALALAFTPFNLIW